MSGSINVYQDGLTGKAQLSIDDDDGGYRLAGAKFSGSSRPVLSHTLTLESISEIRAYLNRAAAKLRKEAVNEPTG